MALTTGTRLGVYEISAKIGEGGMGEVYQARDTKLDRDVALKVLPEAFTQDADRLARFEREAKVLASLNHPNIASIYGLEEQGDTRALVLELVEGPTLADRIKQGALPVDDALAIAKQIADALEAAHEQGIIHRDLKPANIKVRADGTVKVLDFGLAKAVEGDPATATAGTSMSPTVSLTAAATQMGMVIGTAAYMAPEQAKGLPVDKRADIWAFGAVLFEMLTGKRLFEAGDVSEMLASVLVKDPDVSSIGAHVPAHIRSVVRRCLVKDPKDRLRDIGDVRIALQGVFETAGGAPAESAVVRPLRPWQRPIPLVAGALALVIVTGLGVRSIPTRTQTEPPTTKRFTVTVPAAQQLLGGSGQLLSLSPDGQTLVYAAVQDGDFQLFRRPIDQFEAIPIPNTVGAFRPVVLPDGQSVAFTRRRALEKASLLGGPVQTLTILPGTMVGMSWGSDGTIIYGQQASSRGLMQVPAAGGDATPLFTPDDRRLAFYPQMLPDAGAVLFTLTDPGPDAGELHLLELDTGEHRTLLPGASAGRVLDTGHLVFVRGGSLWAVPFDREQLATVGTPVPVLEGVRVEPDGAVQYAVADDGTLAYIPGNVADNVSRQLTWVDRTGAEELLPALPGEYSTLSLSPDGTRAAVSMRSAAGNTDIWLSDLARGTLERLTRDTAEDTNPLWSPDGSRVVFTSDRNGRLELFWQPTDGTGSAELLLSPDEDVPVSEIVAASWSPDGNTLFVRLHHANTARDIGRMTLGTDGPNAWEPLLETEANEFYPTLSPDGRWLAYASNETGRNEVYVRRYPELDGRTTVSTGGGFGPSWTADGRELIYLGASSGPPERVMRVSLEVIVGDPPSIRVGTPERLFDYQHHNVIGGRRHHDVAPDGQRLLMISLGESETVGLGGVEINVVLNWFEELKRLVPVP